MKLLLDSHVILWWLADSPDLSDEMKNRIEFDPDVRVSVASIWELAIKQAVGKLSAPVGIPERVQAAGFDLVEITAEHAVRAARFPPVHRDPFDRVLIAQARVEG